MQCVNAYLSSQIKSLEEYRAMMKGLYGQEYNENWMYIQDVNEIAHYVSLNDYVSPDVFEERFIGTTVQVKADNVIKFRYYKSPDVYENIPHNASKIITPEAFSLDSRPTKVLTHDWLSSADFEGLVQLRDAYLQKNKYNVIIVDWESLANSKTYETVADNTKVIGEIVRGFLLELKSHYGVNYFHLIGLGFGAHIMGVAGWRSSVDRITGLDPFRPHFEYPPRPDRLRLDTTDASFVDIIHTCADFAGYGSQMGHTDFYPNGGFTPQPRCGDDLLGSCSHRKSLEYFIESIKNPKLFLAVECKDWMDFKQGNCKENVTVVMGENADLNSHGKFFLGTETYLEKAATKNQSSKNKNTYHHHKKSDWLENDSDENVTLAVTDNNNHHHKNQDWSDSDSSSETDSESDTKSSSDTESDDDDDDNDNNDNENDDNKENLIVHCNNSKDDKNCLKDIKS